MSSSRYESRRYNPEDELREDWGQPYVCKDGRSGSEKLLAALYAIHPERAPKEELQS